MNKPKKLIYRDCIHGTTLACALCPDENAKLIADLSAEVERLRIENQKFQRIIVRLAAAKVAED